VLARRLKAVCFPAVSIRLENEHAVMCITRFRRRESSSGPRSAFAGRRPQLLSPRKSPNPQAVFKYWTVTIPHHGAFLCEARVQTLE
jgi:hypothetical protein